LSVDLKGIEEAVERAVKKALAEARGEDLKILAEAIKILADYIREGFRLFNERLSDIDTRFEQINTRLERFDTRFEQIDKRFEQIDNRFKRIDRRFKQINTRFEQIDKRFEQIDNRFKRIDRRFKQINTRFEQIDKRLSALESNVKYLMNAVNEIKTALGATMEDYTAVWLSKWLEERGYRCEVKTRVTVLIDGVREIDLLCVDPLVVGEVTTTLRSVDEAEKEIKKLLDNVTYIEKAWGTKHYAKILAVEIAPEDVAEHLRKRVEELGIVLVLGRSYL
jgi:archaellum component FlaC